MFLPRELRYGVGRSSFGDWEEGRSLKSKLRIDFRRINTQEIDYRSTMCEEGLRVLSGDRI